MGDGFIRSLRTAMFFRSFIVKSIIQPIRVRLEDIRPGQSLHQKRLRLRASPEYARILSRGTDDYTHNLSLMIETSRRKNVTPLFVTMPLSEQDPDGELAVLNEALVSLCLREEVPLVDLPLTPPPNGGKWYEPGTHHFTLASAEHAASVIAGAIDTLLEGKRAKGETLHRRAGMSGTR